MRFTKTLWLSLALLAALASVPARAHTDEFLDTQKAPHGGQLRMAGVFHFELVLDPAKDDGKDRPVLVYVSDHAGTKVATAGASASVTLLSAKGKTTVELKPEGDNLLKGMGRYASSPDLKAVVSVTLAGKPAEQARFTPLAKAAAPAEHKH